MNRRAFARLAGLAPLLLTTCGRKSAGAKSILERVASRDDLVILGLGNKAVTWSGDYTGSIPFGGVCCRAAVSVAADSRSMAWIPWEVPDGPSSREETALAVKTVPARATPVSLKLKLPARENASLAISPGAQTAAIFAAGRLEMFDAESGESRESLTELVKTVGGSQPERMQLSADARRLIIGYRNAVVVVGVPEREIIFSGEGRFPSISPDGQKAVYCRDQRMLLLSPQNRTSDLDLGAQVLGIGTWSPDGTMILAGLRSSLVAPPTLSAVDWQRSQFAAIEHLPPDDYGERCCWINRALLSEQHARNSPAPK